jgi:hypothetical protein
MMQPELTADRPPATSAPARDQGAGAMKRQGRNRRRAAMSGLGIVSAGLAGCINIAAPEKPIVIELNVNIRQEVIYRLAEDAANTIEENGDIF